ncbi:MAG: nucleotidyltransferase domain-containing protein [Planctomycetota bacterium]
MTRDAILQTLRDLFPTLQERYKIASLGIFGSVARGDDSDTSDLDVFVRFQPGTRYSFNEMADIVIAIEKASGLTVDLTVDHPDLRPRFRQSVERDLIRVA